MSSRNFIVVVATCLLAVGFLGVPSASDVAWAGKSAKKSRESARNYVLERPRGRPRVRIHLPIGPSYTYYDYPYYYSRGHYPTHIGGYVYYPYNYYSRGSYRGPRPVRRHRARRN